MTKRRHRRQVRERGGVALIAVLIAILIISVLVSEFSTTTNIDYFAANNARDNMRAHFLSRSALNLGELMIRVQTDVLDKHRQTIGDIQIADYTSMFMGAFCGGKEEVNALAEGLGASGAEMEGMGIPYGQCDIAITTEDNKINLNCAGGTSQARLDLHAKLEALFYPDVFRKFFESLDAEGNPRDLATLVKALIDYVDGDTVEYDPMQRSSAPEDYGYSNLKDPYKPKNNRLDSVGEAKLVRGGRRSLLVPVWRGIYRLWGVQNECFCPYQPHDDRFHDPFGGKGPGRPGIEKSCAVMGSYKEGDGDAIPWRAVWVFLFQVTRLC